MLIRKVEEHDIDQLIELCALHAAYEKSAYDSAGKKEKLFSHFFKEKEGLQCVVVEDDRKLKGYATFIKQFSTWDASYYLYLDCIYLKEEVRGQGLGARLMDLAKSYAKQENCFQVQWQTPKFNQKAIDFYKKIGAQSKEKERFFWT